jgi:hypothetical protein
MEAMTVQLGEKSPNRYHHLFFSSTGELLRVFDGGIGMVGQRKYAENLSSALSASPR